MTIKAVNLRLTAWEVFEETARWCGRPATERGRTLAMKGMAGSLPAFLLAKLHVEQACPLVCLTAEEEQAAYLLSDLEQILGEQQILRLPASGHKPYDQEQIQEVGALLQRADVLQQLTEGYTGLLVTSVEALAELIPPANRVREESITLSLGMTLPPATLIERCTGQGFERVEFVAQPGEIAVRGGIVDIYPFTGSYPVRVEFFGDEIDSIREFEPTSQRSISRLTAARIVPNLERTEGRTERFDSLFDHLSADTLVASFDSGRLVEKADEQYAQACEAYQALAEEGRAADLPRPEEQYLEGARLEAALLAHTQILFGTFAADLADEVVDADARPQPSFNGNLAQLRRRLGENKRHGIDTVILCDSPGQQTRLFELLEDEVQAGAVKLTVESLHEGFEVAALGLAVYTDHQIFNRYHRPSTRKQKRRYGGLSLREIQNLAVGDFVVHVDYGIGRFAGLHKITVREKLQEAVKLLFQDNDVLYVNVNALHKLHKYSGKEGHQPRLTKLGSGQWEKTKARTKKRVKDIARELIALYAKRKASKGFAFSADTIWQREMEAAFRYEDTPDQAVTAEAVKEDMEQPIPMDRLVCGDVGFGKTEIAVRAAFKAVQDGKQVAVLVPTTILAAQHHETFSDRLGNYPVRIEILSRFRTAREQKEAIEKLERGEIDIIIGTHRLVSKDVQFKNLGLLVIDEEQRFGVAVKERLRHLRAEVDTLTLTATPIPRTLQFSLLGARDLSIINTPPPNRQPIVTEIHTFDKNLIRDAILYEVSRGGQVFFIHNRVQSIEETASMLRLIVPDIRIRVAHGQMKPSELESVMLGFIEHKFDVLVSTNIIESGLDISNANTIIINHADRFGLSELHQLRGRVGRSDRKAFCYLLVPTIHGLTREARQRLQAVEEFSDLGSGFSIAMRDLDIRGAGNLLGGEQSGFIDEVGFETYHKILDESVQELREEEFSAVFQDTKHVPRAGETTVDVEEDAFIPEPYLSNNVERLNLYRQISEADDEPRLEEIRAEMTDRFGPVPEEVENLLKAAEIKLLGQRLRLPKVIYKNRRLFLYTPSQEEDPYFYEQIFYRWLERLSQLDRRYVMKDDQGRKLRAIVQDVPDLAAAKEVMEAIQLHTAAEAAS